MDNQTVLKKKSIKKHLFVTIYGKLDSALSEYKDYLNEKRMDGWLKKSSKRIAGRIEKRMKKAKQRLRKLEKKAAKSNGKKED